VSDVKRFGKLISVTMLTIWASSATLAAGVGPVTDLPLPRFVSLKASEANVRRGPSLKHKVDWIFQHPGTPLAVVAEYGHWRKVQDRDGAGGWVHYSLISCRRTVLLQEEAEMLLTAHPDAKVRAKALAGVIARLDECKGDWCKIEAGGEKGWVPLTSLWGLDDNLPAAE
jgi:SH3-like domain-containing protein